jgi:fermentation-respiration switch protein FrsA (DUF1100 family)
VEEVEFTSVTDTVRGDLYLPDGDGPHPVIVMAGGWCYVKELRQPQYAEEFVRSGFAALVFDYRRLGASDGEPRQHLDPNDQIEDYKNAISYLETRSDIDAKRIGAWGISYSGGHVLILAATDPRVRCIVSNVAVVEGYGTMWRVHGTEGFRRLRQVIAEDRAKRFSTGDYGYIAMSGDPADTFATWPFEEVRVVFEELKKTQAPRHEHRSTIASVEKLIDYSVYPFLDRIVNTPTLMIVAQDDDITMWDWESDVFSRVRTPKKKLAVLPDTSHMTLYSNLTALGLAAQWAAGWFREHLLEPPTVDRLLSLS